ncbi:MAG: hypothetical protein RBS10_01525 [Thauera propionica]|jgi:hypothetical protein|nr:hypothetical protein [Thauera propionica]
MFVRIRRLRQGGRRIPDHQADLPEHEAVGDLRSAARSFELHQPLSNTGPRYVLHDARVVAVQAGVGGMLIRGFEEYRGCAVLQEWEVTPLDQVIGNDGLKRWNWSP